MAKMFFGEGICGGTVKNYNTCPDVDIYISISSDLFNKYTCAQNNKPCKYVNQMDSCPDNPRNSYNPKKKKPKEEKLEQIAKD